MKKYRYLYRITVIILSCVLIPIIVLSLFFWEKASDELDKSNREYYGQVVGSFASDFQARLQDLQDHALTIVVDSKTNKSIFNDGVAKATEHTYWFYQARTQMEEEYAIFDAEICGVYYYDLDRTVTKAGSFPTKYFLYSLGIRDPEHSAWDFFDEEKFAPSQWIFDTSFMEGNIKSCLMAGFCAELGKNRDKALIIYTLTPESYTKTQSAVYAKSGIDFYILDENRETTLLTIGSNGAGTADSYTFTTERLPLTFEIRISENTIYANHKAFYRDIRLMVLITGIVMVLVGLVFVTIMYKPIFKITAELDNPDSELDEINNIRYALGEQYSKIMEQEMLIMDLLLKHLIHGVPISQKIVNRLGMDQNMDHFCVFVMDGGMLPVSEVEALESKIRKQFSARLFVTDWQAENKCILILFMTGPDGDSVENALAGWLQENNKAERCLTRGCVVGNIDGIRSSFLDCLEKMNAQTQQKRTIKDEIQSLDAKDNQQKILEKRILKYLEIHFRDEDLSQVKVADEFRISTYSLSRLFKNQIGIGFREYVNSMRLEYAKTLLLTSSYSIREIAERSGYTSESYFGRIFKATYGVSPSVFKDQ